MKLLCFQITIYFLIRCHFRIYLQEMSNINTTLRSKLINGTKRHDAQHKEVNPTNSLYFDITSYANIVFAFSASICMTTTPTPPSRRAFTFIPTPQPVFETAHCGCVSINTRAHHSNGTHRESL